MVSDRAEEGAPPAAAGRGLGPPVAPDPVDPIDPADVDLSVDIAGIRMANPVMVASGTFGSGREYERLINVSKLGAIVCKGVSRAPREGNPPPRICETPSGMLNSIGLENPGVDAFVRDYLPYLAGLGIPVIVNVLGETVQEYVSVVQDLERHAGIDAYELNISCPNVAAGGMSFGCYPAAAEQVVGAVRRVSRRPLIAKLTPNVTDITEVASACAGAGANALSLINTIRGMAIDVRTRRPRLATVTGGLSGPAVRPVAVRMVHEVARAVDVPLIGMGGITCAEDALEFILAGATAVAVGTATFVEPRTAPAVIDGLARLLGEQGVSSVRDLVGAVEHG